MGRYFYWNEKIVSNLSRKMAEEKAPADVKRVLEEMDFSGLDPDYEATSTNKIKHYKKVWDEFNDKTGNLTEGDVILFQYPLRKGNALLSAIIRKLKNRKVRTIVLIHNVNYLRNYENNRINAFIWKKIDIKVFKIADYVICHNHVMKSELIKSGCKKEKLVELEIFDYLSFEPKERVGKFYESGFIVAGNLDCHRSGYIYQLSDLPLHLYGIYYSDSRKRVNHSYRGSFYPEELIDNIQGRYGIVWDGGSLVDCEGNAGNYLKYNSPHKVSLYIASEIPIIVWRGSAIYDFICEQGIGVGVDSLYELKNIDNIVSQQEYRQMQKNLKELAVKLREGYYTHKAVEACLRDLYD